MIDFWFMFFVAWMTAGVFLAVFGMTRRGNPHFIGRWLAHRRAGHHHRIRIVKPTFGRPRYEFIMKQFRVYKAKRWK